MAKYLARNGGRFVAAMAVLLAVAVGAATAQVHKTYRCKVGDVVTLADDGHLRADDNPRTIMRLLYDSALIDTLTGAVTNRDGQRRIWKVAREGNGVSDYVLVLPYGDETSAATDFIRVRAWKEQPN